MCVCMCWLVGGWGQDLVHNMQVTLSSLTFSSEFSLLTAIICLLLFIATASGLEAKIMFIVPRVPH